LDDEPGPAAAAEVSDPVSRSPDVHHAGTDAALDVRRLPYGRGLHAAVPIPALCREPVLLRRRREDPRKALTRVDRSDCHPGRWTSRHVGGVAAVAAWAQGGRAREGHRRWRYGEDDQAGTVRR